MLFWVLLSDRFGEEVFKSRAAVNISAGRHGATQNFQKKMQNGADSFAFLQKLDIVFAKKKKKTVNPDCIYSR